MHLFAEDGLDYGGGAAVHGAFVNVGFFFFEEEGFGGNEIATEDFSGVEEFDLFGAAGGVLELAGREGFEDNQARGLGGAQHRSVNFVPNIGRQVQKDRKDSVKVTERPVPGGEVGLLDSHVDARRVRPLQGSFHADLR